MKHNIKKTYSEFIKLPIVKSIWVLVTGTGIAQFLPLISFPVLTRLYDPEHFGIYALFSSLVSVLTALSILEYSNIIIVADTDRKAYLGMALSFFITLVLNSFFFILFLILPDSLLNSFFGNEILPYLWIVPITVFFNTVNLLFYTWFLRKESYSLLSKNKIYLSVFSIFIQIGIGLLYLGIFGLIIANLISILVSLFCLFFFFIKSSVSKKYLITLSLIKKIAFEYRKFPFVSVWGNMLNIFILQIPQIFLNKVFGSQILGHYSLAQNVISFPLGFISSAIQDVFRQSASKEEIQSKSFKESYLSALKISTLIGILLFMSCLTFLPSIFVIVFGDKWVPSAIYIRILAILVVIRFIVGPLTYSFYIKSKHRINFLWQLGLLILSLLSLLGSYYFLNIKNPSILLLIYSFVLSIWYLYNLSLSYKLAKGDNI